MIYVAMNEKMASGAFTKVLFCRLFCFVSGILLASMIYFYQGKLRSLSLSWSYIFFSLSIADRKKSYVCLAVNFPTW